VNQKRQENNDILQNLPGFIAHVSQSLDRRNQHARLFPKALSDPAIGSAVLFLLGANNDGVEASLGPSLILNRRSIKVKQHGDLCCPGGGIAPGIDSFFSKVLQLPFSPLTRWPYWVVWRKQRPREAQRMALFLATALRESFEEMHLNPLRVKFLGPLPSQNLVMFQRVIFPMVGWVQNQKNFVPNWEVEKVVHIPLRDLLRPQAYARYRLRIRTSPGSDVNPLVEDHPCFRHFDGHGSDILWGATFQITMVFLEMIFGFKPPPIESLPLFRRTLDESYLTGIQ
jgi:hypothetical protein